MIVMIMMWRDLNLPSTRATVQHADVDQYARIVYPASIALIAQSPARWPTCHCYSSNIAVTHLAIFVSLLPDFIAKIFLKNGILVFGDLNLEEKSIIC